MLVLVVLGSAVISTNLPQTFLWYLGLTALPTLSAFVRRLHDMNISGLLAPFLFIAPFMVFGMIGLVLTPLAVAFLLKSGSPDANRYGQPIGEGEGEAMGKQKKYTTIAFLSIGWVIASMALALSPIFYLLDTVFFSGREEKTILSVECSGDTYSFKGSYIPNIMQNAGYDQYFIQKIGGVKILAEWSRNVTGLPTEPIMHPVFSGIESAPLWKNGESAPSEFALFYSVGSVVPSSDELSCLTKVIPEMRSQLQKKAKMGNFFWNGWDMGYGILLPIHLQVPTNRIDYGKWAEAYVTYTFPDTLHISAIDKNNRMSFYSERLLVDVQKRELFMPEIIRYFSLPSRPNADSMSREDVIGIMKQTRFKGTDLSPYDVFTVRDLPTTSTTSVDVKSDTNNENASRDSEAAAQ